MGLLDTGNGSLETIYRAVTNPTGQQIPQGLLAPPQSKGFLPGLLSDPWMKIGLSLLARGGPSARPHSFGQDLAGAVGDLQAGEDAESQRQLQREELDRRKRMNEQAEMEQQRQAAFMQQMMQMMGGAAPVTEGAATPPAVGPAIMPPSPGAPPALQVQGTAVQPQAPGKLSIPEQYVPLIKRAAMNTGIPENVLAAQIQHESGWSPTVKGAAGELGLSQFMPKTGEEYGLSLEDRADPAKSIDAQARFMADLLKRNGGDMRKALWRYNASEDNPVGGKYADTVLSLAGIPGEGAEAPAPPPAQQPQYTPGGQAGLPKMSKEVRDELMRNAYQQSGGDPVKMMMAFGKAQQDWTLANAKAATEAAVQAPYKAAQATLESDLGTQRDAAKSARTYSEEEQKLFAKDFDEINKRGQAGATKSAKIGLLGDALSGTYTGAGGETVQDLKRTAQSLGIDVEGVGEGDLARSVANSIALELRSTGEGAGMPGAMSDKDREFLVAMAPGLTKTPEGNKLLVEYYKRLAKREQQVASKAREYKKKNGGRFDDGFYDELQAWADKNPLFPESEKKATGTGGPTSMPPSPKSKAERDALDPGTVYIAPDGSRRTR